MSIEKKDNISSSPPLVELVESKQSKKQGGHDFYWHIFSNSTRAGQVHIDFIEDPILGRHASIHIFLNKKSQGKGIGRIGYREACEKSNLSIIYAHMRKNNIPSQKAALAAGFSEVKNENFKQLVMVWHKT